MQRSTPLLAAALLALALAPHCTSPEQDRPPRERQAPAPTAASPSAPETPEPPETRAPRTAAQAIATPHSAFPDAAADLHARDPSATRLLQQELIDLLDQTPGSDLSESDTLQALTRLYDLAALHSDPEAHAHAHRLFSRHLAALRDPTDHHPLQARIRRFASTESSHLWPDVDVRFVIPLLEYLLDLRDAAALLRLTGHYMQGPLGRQIEHYRQAAVGIAHFPAHLTIAPSDPPCTLQADHRTLGDAPGPHTLAPGSWLLTCERPGHPPVRERIVIEPNEDRTWDRHLHP